MILTVAEDFSNNVLLDAEVTGTPESGLYLNRGVLPVVTVDNMLSVFPITTVTFEEWDIATSYGKYTTSWNKSDIVTLNDVIYQSMVGTNQGNSPDEVDSIYWMETNIESLRIKSFLKTSQENLLSKLSLHRRLIENQFIYDVGEDLETPSGDFFGWAFEPKGSDYVKILINQISFQANVATPVNLYVINQGVLVDTLVLNPNNGVLSFEDVGYTISGKGAFYFVTESVAVYSNGVGNLPLKYDGFICYPINGDGTVAKDIDYKESYLSNGFGFNVSVYLDSSSYVSNNILHYGSALQAQFEIDFINTLRFNANTRTNSKERTIGVDKNYLDFQATDLASNTVARKYSNEIKLAKNAVNATFDRFLKSPKKLTIKRTSV